MKHFLINILIFCTYTIHAQYSFEQQLVSTAGSIGSAGDIVLSYSIGEPIVTTESSESFTFTQGFQQPLTDTILIKNEEDSVITLVVYNGITPNNDGNNDVWIIEGIEQSSNVVHIFDRMGNLVWNTTDYNNTSNYWSGEMKSNQKLPSGTYFYTIELTQANKSHKGWVQIIE